MMEVLIECIHFKDGRYNGSFVTGPFDENEVFDIAKHMRAYFEREYISRDEWHVQVVTPIKPEQYFSHNWDEIKKGEF